MVEGEGPLLALGQTANSPLLLLSQVKCLPHSLSCHHTNSPWLLIQHPQVETDWGVQRMSQI